MGKHVESDRMRIKHKPFTSEGIIRNIIAKSHLRVMAPKCFDEIPTDQITKKKMHTKCFYN